MSVNTVAAGPKVGWRFILMLGLMAAISPLGMSIHVQSIPAIADDLRTSYASVQLTVSLFLLAFAFVQLFVGPLSDRLGRRPVLFGGLAVFGIGALVAAFAPTIEVMIAGRVLQAAGGCASLVTPRAVIRDRLTGVEAARILALVSIIQSSAPIFAPIIGGAIDAVFGWHAIFGFLALYALGIGVMTGRYMPESRPTEDGAVASWGTILSRYGKLLHNRRYLAYSAVFALGTTGYFGFLASGPAVLIGDMGLAPWQFSVSLGIISIQFALSGYVASRLVLRVGIDGVLVFGAILQIVAVAAFWMVTLAPTAIGITAAMCLYTFSNGLLFANALAGATAVDPRVAGSASSMLGSLQFGVGGLVAITVANLPTENFGPFPWILVLLAIGTLLAVLTAMLSARDQRSS
jgi:DHA1 family bicyclomycin/chloramphenicol resistance-like MFS transporter